MNTSMHRVGSVVLSGGDALGVARLKSELDRWLKQSGWSGLVALNWSSLPPTGQPQFEVEFRPGEYQSNGPRRLVFPNVPSTEEISGKLSRWLVELEKTEAES